MLRTQKRSLKDLIESIDWKKIEPRMGGLKLPTDKISVAFHHRMGSKNQISEDAEIIAIRIGSDILQQMRWNFKDRIAFFVSDDDYRQFMLCKAETGGGYKLAQESDLRTGSLKIRWKPEYFDNHKLEKAAAFIVNHEIYEKYLAFRAVPA